MIGCGDAINPIHKISKNDIHILVNPFFFTFINHQINNYKKWKKVKEISRRDSQSIQKDHLFHK